MCFSLAGRLQTRLAALTVGALLTALLVWVGGDQRYFTMYVVMVLVVLDLDIFVYPRLIHYQARWQTYLLGIVELLLILGILRWWLAGTLPLSSVIWFYIASWIGGQLVVNVLLPILDPTWAEHGGEIARPSLADASRRRAGARSRTGRLWQHVVAAPVDTLMLTALAFFLVLEATVIPSGIRADQVAAAVAGAVLVASLARVAHIQARPTLISTLNLGLLVSLLFRGPDLWPFLVAGALAAACRSWLTVGSRPVFNSVAFSLLLTILIAPGVYTTTALWGNSLLLPLAMSNIAVLIAVRSRRLSLVLAFGAVIIAQGALAAHGRHDALQVAIQGLLPTYLVFFGGFVLPEIATTPTRTISQLVLGATVGILGIALSHQGLGLPFVVALLLSNYATSALGVILRWLRLRRLVGERQRAVAARTGSQSTQSRRAAGLRRRMLLGATTAMLGGLLLGGSVQRLTGLDPALLSLPAEPALAGGRAIPQFQDVAAQAGISLRHLGSPQEGSPAVGTGAAWGDYNGDGHLDLYVTDHMGASHLYRNSGDGTFTDVAEQAGVAHPGLHTTSATFVDYDNDGHPDLYVGVAFGPNRLYHNDGNGTFTDVTARSGLGDRGRTMSTAWGDYNGDGYLDVFVANYPDQAITFEPDSLPTENTRTVLHMPHPNNRLYRNNGDGTFTDVTRLLGDEPTWGFGFSAVWFDYNNDGRDDLYVVYDFGNLRQPNTLWRNDGPGGRNGWRFTQVQKQLGVDTSFNPMGATTGDYNNDGWQDIAVTNIGPNMLYLNHHGRKFTDEARHTDVTDNRSFVSNMLNPTLTWGDSFGDFNNDGWLDLYLVAGAMDYQNVPQPNRLYLNDQHGKFIDVSAASGANDPSQGRSVAVGDYDGDGRLDMFVANYGEAPRLYRDSTRAPDQNWIGFQLEGTRSNRDAVGARVTVYGHGPIPQNREVQIGQGLGSCNDKTLHFGLAGATRVDSVEIRWPSGARQTLRSLSANRVVVVREPGPSRWDHSSD